MTLTISAVMIMMKGIRTLLTFKENYMSFVCFEGYYAYFNMPPNNSALKLWCSNECSFIATLRDEIRIYINYIYLQKPHLCHYVFS